MVGDFHYRKFLRSYFCLRKTTFCLLRHSWDVNVNYLPSFYSNRSDVTNVRKSRNAILAQFLSFLFIMLGVYKLRQSSAKNNLLKVQRGRLPSRCVWLSCKIATRIGIPRSPTSFVLRKKQIVILHFRQACSQGEGERDGALLEKIPPSKVKLLLS